MSARGRRSTGNATCESAATLPCPGKCLPTAAIPARCIPRMKARASSAATSGRAWKARSPMTWLTPRLRSSTGAKLRSTPTARSSAAISQPPVSATCRALAGAWS